METENLTLEDANYSEENVELSPIGKIKRNLHGWKEVLLPLDTILNWEKPIYPGIIVAVSTLFFLLIWYFEPSVLTTFSLLGLGLSLIDFLVPLVGPSVLGRSKWTSQQEKRYEQICIRIYNFHHHFVDMVDTMVTLKNERPKIYFLLVMGFLSVLAWMGSQVHNLFLTYIIVNTMLLMPGIRQQKVIQGYMSKFSTIFKKSLFWKSMKSN